jgi:hypothetical protein
MATTGLLSLRNPLGVLGAADLWNPLVAGMRHTSRPDTRASFVEGLKNPWS